MRVPDIDKISLEYKRVPEVDKKYESERLSEITKLPPFRKSASDCQTIVQNRSRDSKNHQSAKEVVLSLGASVPEIPKETTTVQKSVRDCQRTTRVRKSPEIANILVEYERVPEVAKETRY